jgi:hypothetical protein
MQHVSGQNRNPSRQVLPVLPVLLRHLAQLYVLLKKPFRCSLAAKVCDTFVRLASSL